YYLVPTLLHSFPTRRSSDLKAWATSLLVLTPPLECTCVADRLVDDRIITSDTTQGIPTSWRCRMRPKQGVQGHAEFRITLQHTTDRKSTRLNSSHLGISYAV